MLRNTEYIPIIGKKIIYGLMIYVEFQYNNSINIS